MKYLAMVGLVALAACGVDGPPERPAAQRPQATPGISVSGDARTGIVSRL